MYHIQYVYTAYVYSIPVCVYWYVVYQMFHNMFHIISMIAMMLIDITDGKSIKSHSMHRTLATYILTILI